MILVIDATKDASVKLSVENKRHFFETNRLSEDLPGQIKKFLQKHKITFSVLTKIEVKIDPSHFSRSRTVIAVANSLAFALNLNQKMIVPIYSKEPNITIKK